MVQGVRFSEEDLAAWQKRGRRVHETRTPTIETAGVRAESAPAGVAPGAGGGFDKPPATKSRANGSVEATAADGLVELPSRLDRTAGPAGERQLLSGVTAGETAPKRQRRHDEDALQIQVAAFLDVALPEHFIWFHVPNGGRRGAIEAGRLKAMGVKNGAPDVLILCLYPTHFPFVWIELKSPEGVLRREQKAFRDQCLAAGAPWFLCRSLEDVIAALESLQIRLKARPA